MALFSPSASPAVTVKEFDLTGVAPNVSTSTGAYVGNFRWGPVEERTLVSDESGLVSAFAAPNEDNAVDFLSAAYFLKYSNALYIVRENNGGLNAYSAYNKLTNDGDSSNGTVLVKNSSQFENVFKSSVGTGAGKVHTGAWIARYPGALGNGLSVSFCPAADSADTYFNNWDYKSSFDRHPETSQYVDDRGSVKDEIHVAVIDRKGDFSGVPGSVLETFPHLSVVPQAVTPDGSPNYFVDVINNQSKYIHASGYFGDDSATNDDSGVVYTNLGVSVDIDSARNYALNTSGWTNAKSTIALGGGANSEDLGLDNIATGFDLFEDTEQVTVDFLIAPQADSADAGVTVVNDLVSIAKARKDCVVTASPPRDEVVGIAAGTATTNAVTFANRLTNSSYLIVDNNYLKVFDKYNDGYVHIPANSSTAGLMAATDVNAAPWFSPAGQRRGNYLGVTDISVAPNKSQRDTLYKASINPIANIPGASVVLFGDKTHENRPSAFDRINVRRLFLAVERSIAQAAKNIMFEFNDEFTRAEFVNVIEPLLREVKGRRGITDFRVVCDETNNTPAVIDRNEFVASIFIKPARSINFVTLNFVAVRTGIEFDEISGIV